MECPCAFVSVLSGRLRGCGFGQTGRAHTHTHTDTGSFFKNNKTIKRTRSGYREERVNRIPITLTNRRDTRTQMIRETIGCLFGKQIKNTTKETNTQTETRTNGLSIQKQGGIVVVIHNPKRNNANLLPYTCEVEYTHSQQIHNRER